MTAKISISYVEGLKIAPKLPKNPVSYFISTRNLCRIDDLLEIGVGGMALKTRTADAVFGAFLGVAFINPETYDCNKAVGRNEEYVRARRFKSICVSLLMAASMALDDKNPLIPVFAGYCVVHALGRQVLQTKSGLPQGTSPKKTINS